MEKIRDEIGQSRVAALWDKRFSLSLLIFLAVANSLLYAPAFVSYFISDDFEFLRYLFFNFESLLGGQGLKAWLVSLSSAQFLPYFRPGYELFDLLDYTAWGLDPLGCHLTHLALHTLTAFLVFILYRQLTHNRLTAMTAGLLFAMMPIHVEAVSWFAALADGLDALWYLIAVVFFILFRRRCHRTRGWCSFMSRSW